nr:MAG TPA: hypothetical protein [Caudoviricetes sp.]
MVDNSPAGDFCAYEKVYRGEFPEVGRNFSTTINQCQELFLRIFFSSFQIPAIPRKCLPEALRSLLRPYLARGLP